eukprot:TRINITY_DN48450_c0_g1_i1.p1 TRINITY_DN48450_c0_g1~~TRINITY_DN48450_c0_g1_i1.p1  ORF type:complete len:693 (-),score=75.89 TRINITY_DN48450_c0_g1_i1:94-1893(-)
MDDLKNFRQLNSKTPGHPECFLTSGIEVSTGPLGQGVANAIGMAIAAKHLGAVYNKEDIKLFDSNIWAFCGDGCLMEGVTLEAISLAGHLGLGNLVVVYDDNNITIDGRTELAFTENVQNKMIACGWHVTVVEDGNNDLEAIRKALKECKEVSDKPSMICLKTVIGYGSPLEGTAKVHGAPLGAEGVQTLKKKFGRDADKSFDVDPKVYEVYQAAAKRGAEAQAAWQAQVSAYVAKYADEGKELQRLLDGKLPDGWVDLLPKWTKDDKPLATRQTSEAVLNALAPKITNLIGGSADLTGSNLTNLKCSSDFQKDTPAGRYIRFGVREHGMNAIANGIAAYGNNGLLIPYIATFMNFIGYSFGATRMSALSKHQVIYVATHDSIGLGEDGPTHQPIEIAAALRALPNASLIRPADGNETSGAYLSALQFKGPTVLALSRQGLPQLANSSPENVLKGAYTVLDCENPSLVALASGSEVAPAIAAAEALNKDKPTVRVVSFPSWDLFDKQPMEYKKQILPDGVPIVSVEAWATTGWEKYSHIQLGMRSFGASAPGKVCFEHFGFDAGSLQNRFFKIIEFYADAANKATLGSKTAAMGLNAAF